MGETESRRWEARLVGLFVLLVAVGLWRHEIWRDEAQAWLLARDSGSLRALFANSRHEGHPLLWHSCLFFLANISHSLRVMQGFNGLIAIASTVLIIRKSPFSLLHRGLITFGYFSFYEYAVLSRSYGLGVFLVFLFCAMYCQTRPRYWGLVAVLVLMANTSIFGLVLSGSLAIAFFYRLFFSPVNQRTDTSAEPAFRQGSMRSRWMLYGGVLLAGWGLSAYQIARALLGAKAATAASVKSDSALLEGINKLLQIVLKSYLPLPDFSFHFWNGHLLEDLSLLPNVGINFLILSGLLAAFALVWSALLLRQTPVFMWAYGWGVLLMGGLFTLVYRGTTRHYGHLFILLLACLWLSRWWSGHWQLKLRWPEQFEADAVEEKAVSFEDVEKIPFYLLGNQILTAVLCLHVFAGAYAYVADVRLPFSAAYEAAEIVKTSSPSLPLLGLHQRPVSTLSAYLDRPIYYPELGQLGSFWDVSFPEWTDMDRARRSLDRFAKQHPVFLAVLTQPFDEQIVSSGLTASYQGCAGPAIVKDEAYCLYKITRNP